MPIYNELWQAVKKKQYEEIETLIRNHPDEDLVNSVDEDGDSLLSRILSAKVKPLNLIKFMAKQPTLNLHYHSPDSPASTNLSEILLLELEVFNFFEKNPGIIGDEKELAYSIVKESLELAIISYNKEFKKSPGSDKTKHQAQRVENFQAILERLHDLTIQHAFATSDISLLKRLQATGDDLYKPLANGINPVALAAASTPEIAAMFNLAPLKAVAITPKASQNRSAMFASDEGKVSTPKPSPRDEGRMAISSTTHHVRNLAVPSQAEEKASEVSRDEADIMENIHEYVRLIQEQQNITLESDLAQIKIYDESNDVLQPLYDSISEEVLQSEPRGIRR